MEGRAAATRVPGTFVCFLSLPKMFFHRPEEHPAVLPRAHPQRSVLPDDYFFKLLPVALHEIGHLFGMGHSSEPADVMSPFYNTAVKLSDNDKARIAELLKETSVSA